MNKNGTRFKLTIYTFIIFIILGIAAFITHPMHLAAFGAYIVATSLPILTYIVSRSFRGQPAKIATGGTRFKIALVTFHVYVIAGAIAYYLHPEFIGQLTGYVGAISAPIMSYIIGRTIRGSGDTKEEVPS